MQAVLWISWIMLAAPGATSDAKVEVAAIRQVLEKFDKAFQAKDVDGMCAVFSRSPETMFFNADIGDRWQGQGAIRAGLAADAKRIKSVTVEPQPASVHVRGDLAWFERIVVMSLVVREGEMSIFTRSTGVLEKQGGQWLVVQMHTSVGAPRDSTPRD